MNGNDLGVVWTKPFRVEITGSVKAFHNVLEIQVVNLWPNRIIGDAALPTDRRFAHTNISANWVKRVNPQGNFVIPEAGGLLASGLLGPVKVERLKWLK